MKIKEEKRKELNKTCNKLLDSIINMHTLPHGKIVIEKIKVIKMTNNEKKDELTNMYNKLILSTELVNEIIVSSLNNNNNDIPFRAILNMQKNMYNYIIMIDDYMNIIK